MMEKRAITVSELNEYVKLALENDPFIGQGITVTGEVSAFKRYPSGHSYFTIKDSGAAVSCTMFAQYFRGFIPKEGQQVQVTGRVSIYVKEGRYQLIVTSMKEAGIGSLFVAFEMLKKKLGAEGLFDRKRPIPEYARCVGVVTSSHGKAVRDIINVISRRNPCCDILLTPVAVQGEASGEDIARGIRLQNEYGRADVLIVGRGGGSVEDLWGFNTEAVARAVYESRIPVISAVGHETDFTITDMVSDKYAPTPSAAAELSVPVYDDLVAESERLGTELHDAVHRFVERKAEILSNIMNVRALGTLRHNTEKSMTDIRFLINRMSSAVSMESAEKEAELEKLNEKLEALSPLNVLSRGYALVRSESGTVITDPETEEKNVTIVWHDGERHAVLSDK